MKGELWNVSVRGQELTLRATSRSELLGRIERVLGSASRQVSVSETPTVDCQAFFSSGDISLDLAGRPAYRA